MQYTLGQNARFKLDLLFEGVRYSEALGAAAEHAFPNFYPYRFQKDEPDPTGAGKAIIPYLLRSKAGTVVRIKGAAESAWQVQGSAADGYHLVHDDGTRHDIDFAPLPQWMQATTEDGYPMAQTGLSLHGDMGVINVAPGCEYFLNKIERQSMRCTFCAYGAPDKRTQNLGQEAGVINLPSRTYERIQETLRTALSEHQLRHLYLVGGSMTDWHDEGRRFIEIARAVRDANITNVPVTCGSGAIPNEIMDELHAEELVQAVCFNLEVWSRPLFEKICPGKNHYVGYDRWLSALEYGVQRWGRERVYSAMVAGIELEPEYNMDWQEAADLALQGAEDLCARGVIPIYSLYWPVGGRDHPQYMSRLKGYFERLMVGYQEIRERHGLKIWPGFMCTECAYMQMECDMDLEGVVPK
ncbi:MAG: radical SAM protein [Pseudomonadota bacterium]